MCAPGAIEAQRTLPSFLFLGDDQPYVGVYAREQGALVPTKPVHSAKSWLSNPDVDRTAKILPWDAQEAGRGAVAGRSFGARISRTSARPGTARNGEPLSEQRRRADRARVVRRRSARTDRAGGAARPASRT